MSSTERAALAAGDVWLDGELFSGKPDFRRLLAESYPRLSDAERAFLDGPVEEVCALADPRWIERHRRLPEAVWDMLREHRFFGLGFPHRYGGHAFSALAQSTIYGKLATRSLMLSTVVLIPNSVGPGELLLEVGTREQRDLYLPRLARGDEIPCFALTEPGAGSDAAALSSRGELFRDGDGELKIRLDWDKRYITLAPIATLLGLAFRLDDPQELLGRGADVGITVALVPADLEGVEIGRYHDPLGIPFPNGPTRGRGVVIPASQIIGGVEYAGRGWPMLMEALAGGRAISLPAQAVFGIKYAARVAGAYSVVRRQFGSPIGRFEGVQEPLARLAGSAYLLEAARVFTCGALDSGHRPAVISALMKYQTTEEVRRRVADAMDVFGGAGICRGPRNLIADGHAGTPIGITVEGANILTRTLIVFGQGAIRSHPHAFDLLEGMRQRRPRRFRRAFFGLLRHLLANAWRAAVLGLSRGRLARSPVAGPTARYYRKLAWAAARFALWSDLAMLFLGSRLKRRGALSGRFADLLSWQYLGFAALRRFEADGRPAEDLPLVRWAVDDCLARLQQSFDGLLRNVDAPLLGALARGPLLWLHRLNPLGSPPADRLGRTVARALQQPGARRERLTADLFHPAGREHPFTLLERAFALTAASEAAERKVKRAQRAGRLSAGATGEVLDAAVAEGILSEAERRQLDDAARARREAIQVDSFTWAEYVARAHAPAAAEPPLAVAG